MLREAGRDAGRSASRCGFRLATARRPTATRNARCCATCARSSWLRYRRRPRRPPEAAAASASRRATRKLDAAELAAWTTVASIILNLDETITQGMKPMAYQDELQAALTRRHFFGRSGHRPRRGGAGLAAEPAAVRRGRSGRRSRRPARACRTSPPKAKRVIYLLQSGGPSQLDLFDYKPQLPKLSRHRTCPTRVRMGQRHHRHDLRPELASRSRRRSSSSASTGKSGAWVSELLPHTAKIADDIAHRQDRCTPRRSTTTRPSRSSRPAASMPGRPSIGSWLSYGLGSENDEPAGVRRA